MVVSTSLFSSRWVLSRAPSFLSLCSLPSVAEVLLALSVSEGYFPNAIILGKVA